MNAAECYNHCYAAYGKESPAFTTIRKHYRLLAEGTFSLTPGTSTGREFPEELVKHVKEIVEEAPHLSLRKIADMVGSNKDTVHRILINKLLLKKRYAKWIPHTLSDEHKLERVRLAKEIKSTLIADQRYGFEHIITGDESWILYEYLFKAFWQKKDAERIEVPRPHISDEKRMLTVFWGTTATPVLLVSDKGERINAQYFQEKVLKQLSEYQTATSLTSGPILLHFDNAPAHRAIKTREYLEKEHLRVIPHPPYSPDLAPCDFFLFGFLKSQLRGRKSSTDEELEKNVRAIILSISKEQRIKVMENWIWRCDAVIASGGEYY
jgi:histone-lysine N-methyltransferase SETMAR